MHLAKLCTSAALGALMSGAATAASSPVTVNDPTATTRAAHVEPGNRLAVQQVPPTSYFHTGAGFDPGSACTFLAAPPSGKALIVRQVRLTVYSHDTSTTYPIPNVFFYPASPCSSALPVGDVIPVAVGGAPLLVTWDPGIAIPAGGAFSVLNDSGYGVEVYLDGYTVPAAAAPLVGGQTIEFHGKVPAPR